MRGRAGWPDRTEWIRSPSGPAAPLPMLVDVALASVVALLAVAGVLPRWPGLAHSVALPPLDLFADVRVLVTRAPSYPVFAAGLAASVTARSAILMVLSGPPSWSRFWFGTRFYLTALVPAVIAVGLGFSAAAALYQWYFWGGLLVAVVTFLFLGAVPWREGTQLRRGLARGFGRGFRAGTLLAYLGLVVILGGLARSGGDAWSVLLVYPSAFLMVLTARRLFGEPARVPVSRRVGVAAMALILVLVPTLVVFRGRPATTAGVPDRDGSLFLVPGVDSASGDGALFRLDPRSLGYSCEQTFYFSYVGPGAGAPQGDSVCPITSGAPYGKEDTQRRLVELADTFREQVAGLVPPVVVVTHSQGAWIAWEALAEYGTDRVLALLMMGAFPENPVSYPPPGGIGPGLVGSDVLRLLTDWSRAAGISRFDPDAALAREILAAAGALEALQARPLPRAVRALAVVAASDLPLLPEDSSQRVDGGCPVQTTHVGLVTSHGAQGAMLRFLDGLVPPECAWWSNWTEVLAAGFTVPPSDA